MYAFFNYTPLGISDNIKRFKGFCLTPFDTIYSETPKSNLPLDTGLYFETFKNLKVELL